MPRCNQDWSKIDFFTLKKSLYYLFLLNFGFFLFKKEIQENLWPLNYINLILFVPLKENIIFSNIFCKFSVLIIIINILYRLITLINY